MAGVDRNHLIANSGLACRAIQMSRHNFFSNYRWGSILMS
jgi:hypothetical protein